MAELCLQEDALREGHGAQSPGTPSQPQCLCREQADTSTEKVSSKVGFRLSFLQPKAVVWQEGQNHNMTVGITVLRVPAVPSCRKSI